MEFDLLHSKGNICDNETYTVSWLGRCKLLSFVSGTDICEDTLIICLKSAH
jgi:hypothetical protein